MTLTTSEQLTTLVVPAPRPGPADGRTQLRIDGMTCGSCALRIERILNRIGGITAEVNYATQVATVEHPSTVRPDVLVAVVEDAGYTAVPLTAEPALPDEVTEHRTLAALRARALACLLLAAPVVAASMVPAWEFAAWQWVALGFTLPVVGWGALPLHRAALAALRQGTATMDTLVSVGTLAALGWSLYAMLFGYAGLVGFTHGFDLTPVRTDGSAQLYLDVAAAVTAIVLAGRWAQARARHSSGAAIAGLHALAATDATVLRGAGPVAVPATELAVDDLLVVTDGERVATDGAVVEGSAALDVSLLTGESRPVPVGPGAAATGGALVRGGPLVVRATRVGADTQLARMTAQVQTALSRKAAVQRLADRVCGVFVPVVLVLAAATCAFWLGAGATPAVAVAATVAVLIVACPCALGLATPTALLVGTGRAARLGILLSGPEAMESARRVDVAVLDKTGTVTTGSMTVVDIVLADGVDADDALAVAGAVEAASGANHPVAAAVTALAAQRVPFWPAVYDVAVHDGRGVTGETGARSVVVGNAALLAEHGVEPAPGLDPEAASSGRTTVTVAWDGRARAVLVLADAVRPGSAAAIARLRAMAVEPVLVTGDSADVADAVAAEVGITRVVAGALPGDKVDVVRRLQDEGHVVAVVGDGVNDAAALAAADLGMAMGSGTDVAAAAADLTLVRADLDAAADAVALSRRTVRILRGNLGWAFAYNVAALPLAAAGMLHPMVAGAAMVASSLLVVGNSLRLRSSGLGR